MEMLVNIDVDDLDAAIAFYEQGLGLRLARRLFGGAVAEMAGAIAPIYLLQKGAGSAPCPAPARRDYRRHWTPLHLDFVVADVDAAVERALLAGAKLEEGPQSQAWGRIATLSDPFGHGFCLLQWRGRGYGEVE